MLTVLEFASPPSSRKRNRVSARLPSRSPTRTRERRAAQGWFNPAWRRRHFVLRADGELRYYASASAYLAGAAPKGTVTTPPSPPIPGGGGFH